jgi:predicted Zn-dependent peptidase
VQDIDLYGLAGDFYRNYARRMSSVTPDILQKTAQQHLHPENALIVVVGEAKEIRGALEPLGKVTVYNTDLQPMP